MNKLHWKRTLITAAAALVASFLLYQIIKKAAKLILVDSLNIESSKLHQNEPYIFIIFILVVSVSLIYYAKNKHYWKTIRTKNITSELRNDTYSPQDYTKILTFYESKLKSTLNLSPDKYNDIAKYYPKTVYAITGGWRAGKTSASGILLDIIRQNHKNEILSETYHDTFNFGNIDESVLSFFETLSEKTEITEFKDLGKVSSPGLDMSLGIGPISIKKAFTKSIGANETRQSIFNKLRDQNGFHIIIIDDVDRLLGNDQVQWMKVIELLGKFHGKLILIVPLHIDETMAKLENLKFSRNYLEKILPERLSVGVDISFVKEQFFGTGKATERIKRLYSKYLYSVAIREAISVLKSNRVTHRSEWLNLLEADGISGIARAIYEKIPSTEYQIGNEGSQHVSVVNRIHQTRIDSYKPNWLIRTGFLISSIFTGAEPILDQKEVYALRTVSTLEMLFDNHSVVTHDSSIHGEHLLELQGKDYWTEYIWPALSDLESDPNMNNYFTYPLVSKEINELLDSKSVKEERNILVRQILDW